MKFRKNERIGRLNERVQIHFATATVNDYGERIQAWSGLGTYWARVEYGAAKEAEAAGQETVMTAVNFIIRGNAAVTETMRVYYNGRLFDIEAISEDETRQYNTLLCRQFNASGVAEPEAEFSVGELAYTETFTELTGDEITVTVYGGLLPANAAQIFVFLNGQFISEWTHTGSVITLTGFELIETDVVTVTFFA
jgi:SPP1 family predicted phage head-tail adaptor